MKIEATARNLAKQYLERCRQQSKQRTGESPDGIPVDPYCDDPWLDMTGKSREELQRTVPIDDRMREKIYAMVREDFIRDGGLSDYKRGDEVAGVILAYVKTLPGEDRIAANKTCHKIFIQEATRLAEKLKAHDPNWTWGMPADPSILDDDPDGKLNAYA